MFSLIRFRLWARVLLFVLIFGALYACASEEEKRDAHYERGLEYAKAKKYDEAIIEFRNVIQLAPNHADAKYQLGVAYMEKGDLPNLRKAFKTLSEAVEINPELMDAQVRLGLFYVLSNDLKTAREKAELVLAHDAENKEAHRILARVHARNEDWPAAEAAYRKALKIDPAELGIYFELSDLYVKKKAFKAAETLLQKALKLDSGSVAPHVMLARFYEITGQNKQAEAFYRKAVARAPKDKSLYFSLARFYQGRKQFHDVVKTLNEAAEIDALDPAPHIALGDFYLSRKDLPASEAAFKKAHALELEKETHVGQKRLISLYLTQGKKDAAETMLQTLLDVAPKDADALFMKGRLLLTKREGKAAAQHFRQVVQSNAEYPNVYYYLGLAHLLEGEEKQARSEFIRAVKLDPENHLARLALAERYLRSRSFDLAMTELEAVIEKDPENVRAFMMRGDAALAMQDVKKGEDSYQQVIRLAPKNANAYFRLGLLRRATKKDQEAKKLFERALSFDPGFLKALSQIVSMHLRNNDLEGGLKRVNAQIKMLPEKGDFYRLRGELYVRKNSDKKAVSDLKTAIRLDRNDLAAYLALGNLYGRQKAYAKALAELDEALKISTNVVPVYMLKGVIFEAQAQHAAARAAYEQALEINPRFAPAANNLAWIYAEHGGNIDKALSLAQIAKEQFPNNPSISDTLGWIYYKKNAFLKAASLLEESAEKLSENPVVRYHLGMTYFKLGKKEGAKTELEAALKLNPKFSGAETAEQTLKEL